VYRPDGAGGYTEAKIEPPIRRFPDNIRILGDALVIDSEDADHIFRPDGAGGYTETARLPKARRTVVRADAMLSDDSFVTVTSVGTNLVADLVVHRLNDDDTITKTVIAQLDDPRFTVQTLATGDGKILLGRRTSGEPGRIEIYEPSGDGFQLADIIVAPRGNEGFGASLAANDGLIAAGSSEPLVDQIELFEPDGAGGYINTTVDPGTDVQDPPAIGLLADTLVVGAPQVGQPPAPGALYLYPLTGDDGGTAPRASISGAIRFDDGSAAEGAKVDLFATRADGGRGTFLGFDRADADGSYRFDDLDAGCYILVFIAPDDATYNGRRYRELPVCVDDGQQAGRKNVTLVADDRQALVGGTITDDRGKPVPGAKVDLFQTAADGSRGQFIGFRRADDDGRYQFPVTPGCSTLTFIAPEGYTYSGGRFYQPTVCTEPGQQLLDTDASLTATTP
jgi:hypothetical protein